MKIINSLGSDCPRMRPSNFKTRMTWWGPMKIIPRTRISTSTGSCRNKAKTKSKQQHKLSGAQLRMMKFSKKGKVSSQKSSTSSSCLVSKKQKSLINCQITTGSSSSCLVSKKQTSLINCQITTGTSSPILKKHRNRNMHDKRRRGICDLPEELLAEILKRLPIKYILRCRCVEKSWSFLVQSPMFVSEHLNYHNKVITTNHNHGYPKYLLFHDEYSGDLTVRFDDLQCQEYCKIALLPGLPDFAWFGLAYGLICASNVLLTGHKHSRNIYLWNPLINKYKTLPDSPLPSTHNCQAWQALAFGFLPEINDYVVVHIIKPYLPPNLHSVIIGVYSLNSNSWKKSSQDNVFVSGISDHRDDVVFLNGAAFWAGVNPEKHVLMCFDTKTNILCEISLPDWVAFRQPIPVIHQFGESIAYFVWEEGVNHFDMWVLKYDPMNEFSWEKMMCVSPSKDVLEDVLGVRNNGDPVLAKSNKLISYNLDSHKAYRFVDSWDRWTPGSPYKKRLGPPNYVIRPFVESLVLLNND